MPPTSCRPPLHRPFALAIAIASSLAFAAAAAAAPPAPETCDQQDSGERLSCRFGNIVAQQRASAETIALMPDVPQSHKMSLMKQVERTSRARGRTTNEDFKQLTKKSKTTCQVLEISGDMMGDDDGICTGNEDCVEVAGDQVGNDDGICRPRNGKNREACVEICDAEAINSDPENFDDDPAGSLGKDIEEELDGITEQYVQLNQMLEEDSQMQTAAAVLAAGGDPCAAVIARRANANTMAFFVGLASGTRIGADIAERFCDQTVFGANTAAVCAVIEGIAGAASGTKVVFEHVDGTVDSATVDANLACLKSLNTDLAALDTSVGGVKSDVGALSADVGSVAQNVLSISASVGDGNAALATIQTRIDGLEQQIGGVQQMLDVLRGNVAEVRLLLSTPQGQREGFPTSETP